MITSVYVCVGFLESGTLSCFEVFIMKFTAGLEQGEGVRGGERESQRLPGQKYLLHLWGVFGHLEFIFVLKFSNLVRICTQLGPTWANMGLLGANLVQFETNLVPSWGQLGPNLLISGLNMTNLALFLWDNHDFLEFPGTREFVEFIFFQDTHDFPDIYTRTHKCLRPPPQKT